MLLIGLTNTSTGGTFHGLDGIEGFSMDGTRLSIIKEGTKKELEDYVKKQRALAKIARKALDELEERLEWNSSMKVNEYENLSSKYHKDIAITKFHSLIIIEGKLIK